MTRGNAPCKGSMRTELTEGRREAVRTGLGGGPRLRRLLGSSLRFPRLWNGTTARLNSGLGLHQ